MKEGLRSSAKKVLRSSLLAKGGKARVFSSLENVAGSGGSRKRLNTNSAKPSLLNNSSPHSLRSKGLKEREFESLECDHNADASFENTDGVECNADVPEKAFSVDSSGTESAKDMATNLEVDFERAGFEQVACSRDADHATKTTISINSNEDKKAFSSILDNSLLANGSENADAILDVDKTRHEHGNGFQGFQMEEAIGSRKEDAMSSGLNVMEIGSSFDLNDPDPGQDLIISSVKDNSEGSASKQFSRMENGDGELAVANGDASAVDEMGETCDSQMGENSAAIECLKEERVSALASIIVDSAQEPAFFDADINAKATFGPQDLECQNDSDVHDTVTVADVDVKDNGEGDKGMLRSGKRKRGRKRKEERISECNEHDESGRKKVKEGKPQFIKRVLRSRTATMSCGNQEVDIGSNGCDMVGKRKIETDFPDNDELHVKVDETNQQIYRPENKLKRRGRPPKVQEECLPSTLLLKKEKKDTIVSSKVKLRGRPSKMKKELLSSKVINKSNLEDTGPYIVKRRGRPPKVLEENLTSHVINKSKPMDMVVSKKLKRLGRPPMIQGGNLASSVIHRNKLKGMIVSKKLKRLEDSSKHKKVEAIESCDKEVDEKGMSEAINNKRQKVKESKKSSDQTKAKDARIGQCDGKSIVKKMLEPKSPIDEGGELSRREQQQLVRDQINSMIVNAGWTIEYKLRQSRNYCDAVYVDTEGKQHWSSTKAYMRLKKRVDDGVADGNEITAFTIIPEEAFCTLFRHTTKERPRKDKKGNKAIKLGKGAGQTDKGDRSLCKKQGETSLKRRSKPRLLARSSGKGSNQSNNGFMPFSGKRNLLSWMIDLGTIRLGWKLRYGSCKRKSIKFEGTVVRDGILCDCCGESMSVSEFETHAGGSGKQLGRPFNNIYLESGTSLWQCMRDSWRKEEESRHVAFNLVDNDGDDPNDDTCNICGDGGDLICCDGCPSTFHQSCLEIQNFPSGKWHCVYCSCKFCRMISLSTRPADDCPDPVVSELFSCTVCERKFHQPCSPTDEAANVDSNCPSFCGRKCQEIFERLQMYIGVRHELEEGFSWTLLQCSDISQDLPADSDALKVEQNSKLAVAFSIMDECFVPIIDERSGINIIQNVVYNCGSNFRRLNYGGFFTAILERGDEIISAASIRIHGNQVAEMPFIGTRNVYRRQGMCRRLLNAIESALGSLDVETLVIPAITELFETWTTVFGFKPLEKYKRQGLKCMSLVVFPGTDMLEKPLLSPQLCEGKTITATDKLGIEQRHIKLPGVCEDAIDREVTRDVGNIVNSELDHFSRSQPDHTTGPYSLTSVTGEFHKSVEVQPDVENDGIKEMKASSLTCSVAATATLEMISKAATKVTFDLNKDLSAEETDSDLAAGDLLPTGPQPCAKAYELSDSGSQVDKPSGNPCNSEPCKTQPLVLV